MAALPLKSRCETADQPCMATRNVVPALLAICVCAQGSEGISKAFPLRFEPNVGQTAPAVTFVARGPDYTLFLTPGGATLKTATSAVKMSFIGANPRAKVVALDPMEVRSHYLIGGAETWHTDVPGFARV